MSTALLPPGINTSGISPLMKPVRESISPWSTAHGMYICPITPQTRSPLTWFANDLHRPEFLHTHLYRVTKLTWELQTTIHDPATIHCYPTTHKLSSGTGAPVQSPSLREASGRRIERLRSNPCSHRAYEQPASSQLGKSVHDAR